MGEKLERGLSIILTLAAVTIAVVLVRREFFMAPTPGQTKAQGPEYVSDWRSMLASGHLIGQADAPVQIVEFSDLECPFCAGFQENFNDLRRQYGNDVALTYIHYPLSHHKLAFPAAHAAECAARQGRFGDFIDSVFARQKSLGTLQWVDIAAASGVTDIAGFTSCLNDTTAIRRVVAGLELAERLQLRGTPTVFVNGWKYPAPPTLVQLNRIVDSVLAQR